MIGLFKPLCSRFSALEQSSDPGSNLLRRPLRIHAHGWGRGRGRGCGVVGDGWGTGCMRLFVCLCLWLPACLGLCAVLSEGSKGVCPVVRPVCLSVPYPIAVQCPQEKKKSFFRFHSSFTLSSLLPAFLPCFLPSFLPSIHPSEPLTTRHIIDTPHKIPFLYPAPLPSPHRHTHSHARTSSHCFFPLLIVA